MYIITIEPLKKARAVFEEYRLNLSTHQKKAGAVHAFGFCYELSWKMMKRFLEARGQETGSPKDTFRKAFEEKIINDPEIWFDFQKKRNLTAHTYNEYNLNIIVEDFDRFSENLKALIDTLEKLI